MKVWVDKEKCIGCGACVAIAPEIFELGEDGKARAKLSEVNGDLVKLALEAKGNCPTGAIQTE